MIYQLTGQGDVPVPLLPQLRVLRVSLGECVGQPLTPASGRFIPGVQREHHRNRGASGVVVDQLPSQAQGQDGFAAAGLTEDDEPPGWSTTIHPKDVVLGCSSPAHGERVWAVYLQPVQFIAQFVTDEPSQVPDDLIEWIRPGSGGC